MWVTAKIKGFSNYYKTSEGWLIRLEYVTSHQHYKSTRFITFNKRNQARLYRNNKLETWSKRQLNGNLESIEPFELPSYSIIIQTPF